MTIDYAKPIDEGRGCCGGNDEIGVGVRCHCMDCPDGKGGQLIVPVYAVIPEGERPEADEPDDDTVCIHIHGGGPNDLLRDVALPAPIAGNLRFALDDLDFGFTAADGKMRPAFSLTLADAVLWVAEGQLP